MNLTKMRDENEIKETCCCIPVSKSDCLGFAFLACPRVASYLSRHSRLQPLICLIMFILHFVVNVFLTQKRKPDMSMAPRPKLSKPT